MGDLYACGLYQEEGEAKHVKTGAHKEKSVLQAKLTKLAIQIGYVGMLRSACCW